MMIKTCGQAMLFVLLGMFALHQQVEALRIVNGEVYSTSSCSNPEGKSVFPYFPAGVCFSTAPYMHYYFDCDAGTAKLFYNATCSTELAGTEEIDIKCHEGASGSRATGYSCSDVDASKLVFMNTGSGCNEDKSAVEGLSGAMYVFLEGCVKTGVNDSYKVEISANNVISLSQYRSPSCTGELSFWGSASGPLGECSKAENNMFYHFSRVQDASARMAVAGLLTLMVVMFTSFAVVA